METRIGEIVEAGTAQIVAQCYELYELPPLGSLVKTAESGMLTYAVVCDATTTSLEPGRRAVARGKDEASEADIYRANPQLAKLLKSEFTALVVGHRVEGKLYRYLPSSPARIHGFIYRCSPEEIREFGQSFDFLGLLINARLPVPFEEVVAAALREMGRVREDSRAFLVAAGKELAILLSDNYNQLNAVLRRIRQ